MGTIGSFGGSVTSTAVASSTTGKVENITIALANTEQSHTFPANTKSFLIGFRGNGKLKLSFDAGTSGTEYHTIYAGGFYSSPEFNAASFTIYMQSATAGMQVELVSWS